MGYIPLSRWRAFPLLSTRFALREGGHSQGVGAALARLLLAWPAPRPSSEHPPEALRAFPLLSTLRSGKGDTARASGRP